MNTVLIKGISKGIIFSFVEDNKRCEVDLTRDT